MTATLLPADYLVRCTEAVRWFWRSRGAATGQGQGGTRNQVTSGLNMNGFCELVGHVARHCGFPADAVHDPRPPFLAWLMLLEENPESMRSVGVDEPHFAVFPEFRGASYAGATLQCGRVGLVECADRRRDWCAPFSLGRDEPRQSLSSVRRSAPRGQVDD